MKKVLIILLAAVAILAFSSASLFADAKDKKADVPKEKAKTEIFNGVGKINNIDRIYITRAEFISQLKKALGINLYYFAAPDVNKVFSDVKNSDKYANEIYDMYSAGIIDDTGTFRPIDKLTREEAVHYLVRAYNYKTNSAQVGSSVGPQNIKPVNKGYLKEITQAQRLGIVEKGKVSEFKRQITRAEAVSLIKRVTKLVTVQKPVPTQEVVLKPTYSFTTNGLSLSASVVNNGKDTVTIDFSSGHQIDFILLDGSNNMIYNSSLGKMFIQSKSSVVLKPGESKTYSVELIKSDVTDRAAFMKVRLFGTINGKEIKEEALRITRFLGPPVKKPTGLNASSWASLDTQNLQMGVNLTNYRDSKVSFNYQPGRLCDYVLLDENKNEIYRWSTGRMFPMIMMRLELNPGETKEFKEVISYADNKSVIDRAKYLKVEMSSSIDGMTVNIPEIVEINKLNK